MGYVFCTAPCLACGIPFIFNPMRVPSLRINGVREPICESCMIGRINPTRVARGLAPFEIMPGAYEACDESELGE
jgi:hypothetical protein